MTEFQGQGLGKVILCGEHAVVYGTPAIAVGLDRGTTVALWRSAGRTSVVDGGDARLLEVLYRTIGIEGWRVRIRSELWIGRGLGSSAALAVGLVRAHAGALGEVLDPDTTFERSLAIERIFHGDPSGIDNLIAAQGGTLWYRKGEQAEPLPDLPASLVVMDSGSAGDTRQLVAGVRERMPGIEPEIQAIDDLVHQARKHLDDPIALGEVLYENHRRLDAIGVSTPALDALVQLALAHGAHGAKLAGAGGGGVVIALTSTPNRVMDAAHRKGIPAFTCRFGA